MPVAAAAAISLCSHACILKTDIIGSAFNGGALDSEGDPFRVPSQLAASRVERIVEQELADGYFHQGPGGEVGGWASAAASNVEGFVGVVNSLNVPNRQDASTTKSYERTVEARKTIGKLATTWTGRRDPICKPPPQPGNGLGPRDGVADPAALELFLDEVRFKEAVARAAQRVARLTLEGLADVDAVRAGAGEGFRKTAAYLNKRQWKRREDRKTAALAVEGGAATGIFSAGAVWVALHLIDGWMSTCQPGDDVCRRKNDVAFRLISGTSTGAMVAVAVDRFNSAQSQQGRSDEMNNIAKWFTCYSFTDLMCVQSTGIQNLFGSGQGAIQGALEFDGIQRVLTSCVKPWMLTNPSELIVNSTEFRSGRIFDLSDQNELTGPDQIVHGAVASALLPVIGDTEKSVPGSRAPFDVPYEPSDLDRTEPAYLDGGIRSELPVLPLVRRGAERVLAVASGASMIPEMKRLQNALDVFVRYINVNTGAVTETELEYSRRLAESERQSEIEACMNALYLDSSSADAAAKKEAARICDGSEKATPFCSRWNICHGDYAHACTYVSEDDFKKKRDEDSSLSLALRIQPFWKMEGIFVDQSDVQGLNGYDFNPSDLRRLFRAGAEAARVRCLDLATLLGILPEDQPASKEMIKNVNQWCAAKMNDTLTTCGWQPENGGSFTVRACGKPIDPGAAARLNACPSNELPK